MKFKSAVIGCLTLFASLLTTNAVAENIAVPTSARLTQGSFTSESEQVGFERAAAKVLGNELRIANPEDSLGAGAERSLLGYSVAISGNTAVVGAASRVLYTFNRNGASWSQGGLITNDDGWFFQQTVAIHGDTIIATAGLGVDTAVYVFTRSNDTWTQQAVFSANSVGADANRTYGRSLAISGDIAVVGAFQDSPSPGFRPGAAYVFTRTGTNWTNQAKLFPADGANGDEFGTSVAVSGNTALVSAPKNSSFTNSDKSGATYVFVRDGNMWTQQTKLRPNVVSPSNFFGDSVTLDGNTAVIGADTNNGGSAYVFARVGEIWIQQAKLRPSSGLFGEQFGRSVAIAGDTVVVGAWNGLNLFGEQFGVAYVFVRNSSSWAQQARLSRASGEFFGQFGFAVAVAEDTIMVGQPFVDTPAGEDAGSATFFTRIRNNWSEVEHFAAVDGGSSDLFGSSVSVAGGTAVIGVTRADIETKDDAGAAYVFVQNGSNWIPQVTLYASDPGDHDQFGVSVAVAGDTILIGASQGNSNTVEESGAAYVFIRSGSSWKQEAKLRGDGTIFGLFGQSVSIEGDTAIVGEPADEVFGRGAAYVFTRSGGTWLRQAKLTADDGGTGDAFGSSVSILGNRVIVGAPQKSNGSKGAAYVFSRNGSSWVQEAKLIGSGAFGKGFGSSIAISGETALVGAPLESGGLGAGRAGAAYVFFRSGGTWREQARLPAPIETNSQGAFGRAVALSGDTAIIASELINNAVGVYNGAAYVFHRDGAAWTRRERFSNIERAGDLGFGRSVAINGETAFVGAPTSLGDFSGHFGVGAMYIYNLNIFTNGFED